MSNGQSNATPFSSGRSQSRIGKCESGVCVEKNTFVLTLTSVQMNAGVHVTHHDWLTLWLLTFPRLFIPLVDAAACLNAISGTGLICQVSLDWFTLRVWFAACIHPADVYYCVTFNTRLNKIFILIVLLFRVLGWIHVGVIAVTQGRMVS